MQLASNVARDADARGRRAGVGHGPRDVRGAVVHGRDGTGGGRRATAVAGRRAAVAVGVADAEVLDEAGERHCRAYAGRIVKEELGALNCYLSFSLLGLQMKGELKEARVLMSQRESEIWVDAGRNRNSLSEMCGSRGVLRCSAAKVSPAKGEAEETLESAVRSRRRNKLQ